MLYLMQLAKPLLYNRRALLVHVGPDNSLVEKLSQLMSPDLAVNCEVLETFEELSSGVYPVYELAHALYMHDLSVQGTLVVE